jgi:hypothetical protein
MAGKLEALMRMASGAADEVVPILRRTGDEAMDALGAVAKKADDWGWKGGKPGEITGGMLSKTRIDSPDRRWYQSNIQRQLVDLTERKPSSGVSKNYARLKSYVPSEAEFNIANDFSRLESAGVPREWTGKVLGALYDLGLTRSNNPAPTNLLRLGSDNPGVFGVGRGASGIPMIAEQVSDLMRPMTNDQRTVFVGLLPDWDDSIESLAKTVRNIA